MFHRCVWWDLHADLLDESKKPPECIPQEPSGDGDRAAEEQSWSEWAWSFVGS